MLHQIIYTYSIFLYSFYKAAQKRGEVYKLFLTELLLSHSYKVKGLGACPTCPWPLCPWASLWRNRLGLILISGLGSVDAAPCWLAQLVECQAKKLSAILLWVWFPGTTRGFFSQSESVFGAECLHSPCVQLHASAFVYMLKIPNTGSPPIVWTHRNTASVGRNE